MSGDHGRLDPAGEVVARAERHAAQGDLAAAVGIEGPTLTHHLNRMETDGLVTRTRDPDNREYTESS